MEIQSKIDSRLIPEALNAAGLSPDDAPAVRTALAQLVTGCVASPVTRNVGFVLGALVLRGDLKLELFWDGVGVTVTSEHDLPIGAVLEKFSRTFDEAVQQKLKFETGRALLALNEAVRKESVSLDDIRDGKRAIDAEIAQSLREFYLSSYDRVIHEEIAGLLVKPVEEKAVRLELARFVLSQFPIPAKRVQRVTLCQALENLAEPELAADIATMALDPQYESLRGRLCMALARTKAPSAAALVARILEEGDDETKVWALEALGELKATAHAAEIEKFRAYQSADKEWTRAINKAAEKAIRLIGK